MRLTARDWGIAVILSGAVGTAGLFWWSSAPGPMPALTPDNDFEADPTAQVAALTEWEAAPSIATAVAVTRRYQVAPGDTLAAILIGAGLSPSETSAAVAALRPAFDPRRHLGIGDELFLTFQDEGATGKRPGRLVRMVMPVQADRTLTLRRSGDAFVAVEAARTLERQVVRVEGRVATSLYDAAQAAGLPQQALQQLVRLFSYDVDFQRDVAPGDRFEALFERVLDDTGKTVNIGDIQFARLILGNETRTLYRFVDTQGAVDYYSDAGASLRKALLRTPVDGARLSSGFGKRRHPMLGYTQLHAGVDFAAPQGTPVIAAGDGVIEEVGPKGSFGNYLRLRHGADYATAYAHLSRFARGLKRGSRVRQGDVIAYVGSTGRSTGSHLHYEIHRDGRPINPTGVNLPGGRQLSGPELARFRVSRESLLTRFAALAPATRLAAATTSGLLCPDSKAAPRATC